MRTLMMWNRFVSFLFGRSFPAKVNYPVYYYARPFWWTRIPFSSRIMLWLGLLSQYIRKRAFTVIVNERIVEIPLVMQAIGRPRATILDVGCSESFLSLHLASMGHHVVGVDINEYEFRHPFLRFVKGDIFCVEFPADYFDYIVFLSTLEHIGLGAYGDAPRGDRADAQAIQRVHRWLKPEGRVVLSVPYGSLGTTAFQRVYDEQSLHAVLKGFKVEVQRWFKGEDHRHWIEVSKEEAADVDSLYFTQAMSFVIARKA